MTTEATPEILWEYTPDSQPFVVTRCDSEDYKTISRHKTLEEAIAEGEELARIFTTDHITVTKEERSA